jgi:ribonuclease Z
MIAKLTVLGTSAAVPANNRNLSGQLIETDKVSVLFDCGEATQFQLKRYKIDLFKLGYIFISHLHGDHFFGLPGLISTMNMMGRTKDLTIFSPPGLEKAIKPLFNLSNMKLEYKVSFVVLSNIKNKKEVLKTELFNISAFPLDHSVETYGYVLKRYSEKLNIKKSFVEQNKDIETYWFSRIKKGEDYINSEGKVISNSEITNLVIEDISFAYCTDTGFKESIAEWVESVDLLYHESTYLRSDENKAIKRKHSTAGQAATVAKLSGAKKLLLGHFSSRYKDVTNFKNEASEIFHGEVLLAKEGLQIDLTN